MLATVLRNVIFFILKRVFKSMQKHNSDDIMQSFTKWYGIWEHADSLRLKYFKYQISHKCKIEKLFYKDYFWSNLVAINLSKNEMM